MSCTTLEAVAKRESDIKAANLKSWHELVEACRSGKWPDGREVDPDAVLILLERLRRNSQDLQAAIEANVKWHDLAEQIKAGHRAECDSQTYKEQLKTIQDRFAIVEAKHDVEVQKLLNIIDGCGELVRAASEAQATLISTMGPGSRETLAALESTARAAEDRLAAAKKALHGRQVRLEEMSCLDERGQLGAYEKTNLANERASIEQMKTSVEDLTKARANAYAAKDAFLTALVSDPVELESNSLAAVAE